MRPSTTTDDAAQAAALQRLNALVRYVGWGNIENITVREDGQPKEVTAKLQVRLDRPLHLQLQPLCPDCGGKMHRVQKGVWSCEPCRTGGRN